MKNLKKNHTFILKIKKGSENQEFLFQDSRG